jgi:hypothetical protein
VNLLDSEKCRDFRLEAVRASDLIGAIRAFDLLAWVDASSNAVVVGGGVERLQRLLFRAQTIAVVSEAMMSEWRRRAGLNESTLNDSKMIRSCSIGCVTRSLPS